MWVLGTDFRSSERTARALNLEPSLYPSSVWHYYQTTEWSHSVLSVLCITSRNAWYSLPYTVLFIYCLCLQNACADSAHRQALEESIPPAPQNPLMLIIVAIQIQLGNFVW